MIKLLWNNRWLKFEKIEWSGTDNQCSRQITFTIPSNPYDSHFEKLNIKLGDFVWMYSDKTRLFFGSVTDREKAAEAGSASYTAKDFMHYLLRSNTTRKFKDKSPEKITQSVCKELGIGTTALAKTGINIPKIWFEDQGIYDIIVKAYRKAVAKTGKKYMPTMVGKKVSVIVKGQDSKVTLDQSVDITSATYHDTTDNMVNLVKIYNASLKQIGKVQNKKHVAAYGTYQLTYTKEKGVDAKKEAKSLFVGITREASVEAIGDVRAIAGKSLEIHDKAMGLSGKFYIQSDTHTFENGVHTMSLELSWSNTMEAGAESTADKGLKELTNAAKAYYLSGSSYYHSSKSCSACKGKNTKTSTVAKIKKIKVTTGKNKGKRKYKPCSKCWIT